MGGINAFSHDSDLTGLWSGEYWYAGVSFPTPFTAHIIDMAGNISGTTLEPNTFAKAGLSELSADIDGARGALTVRFTKLYHRAPGVHQMPVYYSGVVDAKFTMIDGDWTFNKPDALTGRFVLVRVSRGSVAAAQARAAAEVVRR
jgi:hypothetical protein